MELAITFDDLPGTEIESDTPTRLDIARALTATFQKYQVPSVYGFVNGMRLAETPSADQILDFWVERGHALGNHTYSHLDLDQTEVSRYLEDIHRNDEVLARWGSPQTIKHFRFPYLNCGKDQERLGSVTAFLKDHRYVVSEVTIDFADWRWNHGLSTEISTFVEEGVSAFKQASTLAALLLGRPIKHVLLLHFGLFTSQALGALLGAYQKEGARFISLEEALTDEIYRSAPPVFPSVGTLLNKMSRFRYA